MRLKMPEALLLFFEASSPASGHSVEFQWRDNFVHAIISRNANSKYILMSTRNKLLADDHANVMSMYIKATIEHKNTWRTILTWMRLPLEDTQSAKPSRITLDPRKIVMLLSSLPSIEEAHSLFLKLQKNVSKIFGPTDSNRNSNCKDGLWAYASKKHIYQAPLSTSRAQATLLISSIWSLKSQQTMLIGWNLKGKDHINWTYYLIEGTADVILALEHIIQILSLGASKCSQEPVGLQTWSIEVN